MVLGEKMIDKNEMRAALVRDWSREILGKLGPEQRAAVEAAREPALTVIIGQMILAGEAPREMKLTTIDLENGMTVAGPRDDGAFETPSVQRALGDVIRISGPELATMVAKCEYQLAELDPGLPELVRRSVAAG
jgi:hypothetical protein